MSDQPVLRRMRWWDIPAAHRLEVELFPDPWSEATFWSELAYVPATRHYLVAEWAPAPATETGADIGSGSGGELAGYAGLAVAGHQADVQTIAVSPRCQGRGVGALLLTALLDEARRRDATEVLLEVRDDNAAAIALYVRFGFERIAVRRGYYPGGVDAIVMRRRP